jgi:hypothetical protein
LITLTDKDFILHTNNLEKVYSFQTPDHFSKETLLKHHNEQGDNLRNQRFFGKPSQNTEVKPLMSQTEWIFHILSII